VLRGLIEEGHAELSVRRQCELLGLNRSTLYYQPAQETEANLRLMRLIDAEYTAHPFYGSRKIGQWLRQQGEAVNRKRVQRLMRAGFMYLAAIIDWFSRYVLAWRLSNTLDGSFCLEMLEEALSRGQPEVFNTDQGVQFTAEAFTGRLVEAGVAVSMDGKGRCLDNVFVERLWRSVKYEDIYPGCYETVPQLASGLERYFPFYNEERPHQSLEYRTPTSVYGRGGGRSAG